MSAARADDVGRITSETPNADLLLATPTSIVASGLSSGLLEDIVARQLQESGALDLGGLSSRTALSSRLLEQIIDPMRADARVEIRAGQAESPGIRFLLTDQGKRFAEEARQRSGYVGPAPISVEHYTRLIRSQSVHDLHIQRHDVQRAMDDLVLPPRLLDRLGAAMHSGKAIFVHGPAGTGKTYVCSRLIRLFDDTVRVPHAVVVGDSIVRIFDPAVHEPVDEAASPSAWIADRPDRRLVPCRRPFVCSGGELTEDQLEVRFDASTRQYFAPLQLKATHGIYMIDDLGRQKMSTDALFNRWIVPMEAGIDYLNLASGARLAVPFDVILMFSTNMSPEDLDDPAFQRRVGHKIGFDYTDDDCYRRIWSQECERRGIVYQPDVVDYAIDHLHRPEGVPKLACHPRDLIGMSLDYSLYASGEKRLDRDALELAWQNYIVRPARNASTPD